MRTLIVALGVVAVIAGVLVGAHSTNVATAAGGEAICPPYLGYRDGSAAADGLTVFRDRFLKSDPVYVAQCDDWHETAKAVMWVLVGVGAAIVVGGLWYGRTRRA